MAVHEAEIEMGNNISERAKITCTSLISLLDALTTGS